jgi:hypothetical protein
MSLLGITPSGDAAEALSRNKLYHIGRLPRLTIPVNCRAELPEGACLGKMKNYAEKTDKFLTERLTDVSRETYLAREVGAARPGDGLFHVKHKLAGETDANQ